MTTILWFGRDLRLADNRALLAAVGPGAPVIPLFILDDEDAGDWAPGGASRWWLHASLQTLEAALRRHGSQLILRRGKAAAVLDSVVQETGASAVYWSRRYEPWALARNERIKKHLSGRGIDAQSFNAALLREPWTLRTQNGDPYRIFTPFWKALRAAGAEDIAPPPPRRLPAPAQFPRSDTLADWGLRPTRPDWAAGLAGAWTPGEQGAQERLREFADGAAQAYRERRNIPGILGTSRLSAHLHFGEIGPRQIWRTLATQPAARLGEPSGDGVETFLSEIAWREFSYHLLFHFPALPSEPLRPQFGAFPWVRDPVRLAAWQRGLTGYPIVDAGMRELWATGWMHNRVRMIVASFLIKDLLVDWRQGAAWFWDTLVDADLASNSASWQWVAGCGADAAPFFRVFNPALQGAKFDPDGTYVRRWVPELAKLPDSLLHEPWSARPVDLSAAGFRPGRHYPLPIVDHALAREKALQAFARIRNRAEPKAS
jgi:deoxyribodipyrimidine photo-lyase